MRECGLVAVEGVLCVARANPGFARPWLSLLFGFLC